MIDHLMNAYGWTEEAGTCRLGTASKTRAVKDALHTPERDGPDCGVGRDPHTTRVMTRAMKPISRQSQGWEEWSQCVQVCRNASNEILPDEISPALTKLPVKPCPPVFNPDNILESKKKNGKAEL